MVLAEFKFQIAQFRDFRRVGDGLRVVGEEGGHLLLRFDKELPGFKAHPVGLIQGLARLDAHEDILHLRVLPAEVVGIIGDNEGDAGLLTEADQVPVYLLLGLDAVVLELQVVAVLPEEGPHLQGRLPGLVVVPRQQQLGNLPAQTGGAGDQSGGVRPE